MPFAGGYPDFGTAVEPGRRESFRLHDGRRIRRETGGQGLCQRRFYKAECHTVCRCGKSHVSALGAKVAIKVRRVESGFLAPLGRQPNEQAVAMNASSYTGLTFAAPGPLGRVARLLRLRSRLRGEGGAGAEELCQEFAVSLRTLQRDFDLLRLAGDKIEFSTESGRYHASGASCLLAEILTFRQFAAVFAALEGVVPSAGSQLARSCQEAAANIRKCLSEECPSFLNEVEGIVQEFTKRQSVRPKSDEKKRNGPFDVSRGLRLQEKRQDGQKA